MPDYTIDVYRLQRKGKDGELKTEIWAEIIDEYTGLRMNRILWWEDDEGIYHDATVDIPVELRDLVDNAWIEKRRTF